MTIATVRRLAADIFNIGKNKVRISPEGLKDAEGALTRSDVKELIEKGIITKVKPQGRASKRRRRRRGQGRRKGTSLDSKKVWMEKIRAQRRFLFMLLDTGILKKESKRMLYRKIKSGIFRSKRAMLLYLKENKLVPADYEPSKSEFKGPELAPNKKEKVVTSEMKKAVAKKESEEAPGAAMAKPAQVHKARHTKQNAPEHETTEHKTRKKEETHPHAPSAQEMHPKKKGEQK